MVSFFIAVVLIGLTTYAVRSVGREVNLYVAGELSIIVTWWATFLFYLWALAFVSDTAQHMWQTIWSEPIPYTIIRMIATGYFWLWVVMKGWLFIRKRATDFKRASNRFHDS